MDSRPVSPLGAADFGSRFSAFMIDGVLLFAGQWIVVLVLSRQLQAIGLTSLEPCEFDPTSSCEGPNELLSTLLILILVGSTLGYHAFFEGRLGATPGKRWMGLQVALMDGTSPIGWSAGMIRSIVRQLFWLVLFLLLDASPIGIDLPAYFFLALPALALIPLIQGALAPDGRGLHDVLAGTIVLRPTALQAGHTADDGSTSADIDPETSAEPHDRDREESL